MPARSTITWCFFSLFFDQKWSPKGIKNEVMHRASQTLLWKRAFLTIFLARYRFLVDFGSQGAPNWVPKSIPKRQNRILVPPGGPGVRQGAILGRFWVDFGGVLRPLGSILAPFWGYRGSKKCKLQRISENSSKQQQTAQKSCKYKAQSLKLKAYSLRLVLRA